MRRSTSVVSDRIAGRRVRDSFAVENRLGHRVLTLAGLATQLAGGFGGGMPSSHLKRALQEPPLEQLGALASIAELPGFARAAANTLTAIWNAGIDLAARAAEPGAHGRWAELLALQEHVRQSAPFGAQLPQELVDAATARLRLAPRLLGEVRLELVDEVPPVYRPLLIQLAEQVPTSWLRPHAPVPAWTVGTQIRVAHPERQHPSLRFVSCADPEHEVLEALRWARKLLVSGVPAEDIAVVAVDVNAYDAALRTLARSSNLPIHFAQGVALVSTAEGQFTAAMADALLNGPTQARVRRLCLTATAAADPRLGALPPDWCAELAPDAALNSVAHWGRALEPLTAKSPHVARLIEQLVVDLSVGPSAAVTVGERWLTGPAQDAWHAALAEGPAEALPTSLQRLKLSDHTDPSTHVLWASAATALAWPRRFVRLLGLSARSWPRRSSDEDPLLPRRILGDLELRERSTAKRDADHLHALLAQTATEVVLSRPRRGSDGRKQSPSPLLRSLPGNSTEDEKLPRGGKRHAISEADRRAARPAELEADAALGRARAAFRSFTLPRLTQHDGLVRARHPVVARALARRHSATSLKKLLLNPHGFIATYALGWAEPQPETEILGLDPLNRGALLHEVLEECLTAVQELGGFSAVDEEQLSQLVTAATVRRAVIWEMVRPVPPPLAWRAEQQRASRLALEMLTFTDGTPAPPRSYAEVKFGYAHDELPSANGHPWLNGTDVTLPGTHLRLRGVIDRLDLDTERKFVRVIDYKSGKPKDHDGAIDGGEELQRTLYTIAVKQLLGSEYTVEAGLLYAGSTELVTLNDPDASVAQLTSAVQEAVRLLEQGNVLPGPAITSDHEETLLAYPAVGTSYYYRVKEAELSQRRQVLDALLAGPASGGEGVQA